MIEKGIEVFIPAQAIQNDEKYYEQPEKFLPERFMDEGSAAKNLSNRPYIPFGDGPRNCIGMRMGKMQTKVGMALMLQKFRYELGPTLQNQKMDFDPKVFLLAPRVGVNLRVFHR